MEDTTRWTAAAKGNVVARDALLAEHLNLVHFVARKLARSLSADADPDEMLSVGALGLVKAVESFDPNRGLAFSTYAVPRIRGAILDEMRRQDLVPRSVRRKRRELSQARESLMLRLGRDPRDVEVAAHIGIDIETLWRWESDIERTVHVSLSSHDTDGDDAGGAASPIRFLSASGDQPDEGVQREERLAILQQAISELKDQQRTVLSLHYFEDLNAREIASVLGVSESRVSQIRSKALSELRRIMTPMRASA
ncbi:FliA/WhiG family RNA polymerase sigma factor [soil metagenome]